MRPSTVRVDRDDITDQRERVDRIVKAERKLPTDSSDAADPTDPTDRNEPTEAIDRTEPLEAIDRNESCEHSDHLELDGDELVSRVTVGICIRIG